MGMGCIDRSAPRRLPFAVPFRICNGTDARPLGAHAANPFNGLEFDTARIHDNSCNSYSLG